MVMIFSKEISKEEAKDLGVNMEMVELCKMFRKLAKLDRLSLDTSKK